MKGAESESRVEWSNKMVEWSNKTGQDAGQQLLVTQGQGRNEMVRVNIARC